MASGLKPCSSGMGEGGGENGLGLGERQHGKLRCGGLVLVPAHRRRGKRLLRQSRFAAGLRECWRLHGWNAVVLAVPS